MRRINIRTESLAVATAFARAVFSVHGATVESVTIQREGPDAWPVCVELTGAQEERAWRDILGWATTDSRSSHRGRPSEERS